LEKSFRKVLKLEGTPIRIEMKSDSNPFTEKEDGLSPKKIARDKRVVNSRKKPKH